MKKYLGIGALVVLVLFVASFTGWYLSFPEGSGNGDINFQTESGISDLSFDSSGNIVTVGYDIIKYNSSSGDKLWSVSTNENVDRIEYDKNTGDFFMTGFGDNAKIARFNAENRSMIWKKSLSNANGIDIDNEGNIFVERFEDVTKMDKNGNVVWTISQSDLDIGLSPSDIAVDNNGNIVVSSFDNNIVVLNSTGNLTNEISTGQRVDEIEVKGDYVYAGYNSGEVEKLNKNNGSIIWGKTPNSKGMSNLDIDSEGDVYVSYFGSFDGSEVFKIDSNGTILESKDYGDDSPNALKVSQVFDSDTQYFTYNVRDTNTYENTQYLYKESVSPIDVGDGSGDQNDDTTDDTDNNNNTTDTTGTIAAFASSPSGIGTTLLLLLSGAVAFLRFR